MMEFVVVLYQILLAINDIERGKEVLEWASEC